MTRRASRRSPTACASSPITCRISRRCRSASGSAPARATRRTREHGISHLLEHMAFKGTRAAQRQRHRRGDRGGRRRAQRRDQPRDDRLLRARAEGRRRRRARHPGRHPAEFRAIADDELEREREVILQEIAATRDSPDEIAYDLLQEAAFPEPAGRPADPRHAGERRAASRPTTCARSWRATTAPAAWCLSAAGSGRPRRARPPR